MISSRLKGGYGSKEVPSWAPMYDFCRKSGVSTPRLDDSSGDRAVEAEVPSLASKDDLLTQGDDDGGGEVNDGWVWQSREKNDSSRKKPKPRAADVDSKSTFHSDPADLAVEMRTRSTCIDRVPSSAPARFVDSRRGTGLTSFKARSSGKDRTMSSPTTHGHRTDGYRTRD